MAAVFASAIAVCREWVTAVGAGVFIYRFPFHAVLVAVPPGSTASVRAELPWLLLGDDLYQLSALLTGNGILGGITTGESIDFRVAFKPVSSLSQPQRTITDSKQPIALQISGRHDVCVAPRAVAVVRAMAALTLIDQLLCKN